MHCGKHQQSRHKKGEKLVTPPNKVKVEKQQSCPSKASFLTLKKRSCTRNPAVMRYYYRSLSLSYYNALIPSYRILSRSMLEKLV